jgi:DNA mismatch repair protein MutS
MTLRETTDRGQGTGDAPSAGVPVSPHPPLPAPRARFHPLSLLAGVPAAQAAVGEEDRSYARDLNLDQIVATVAGDREERDLIASVLFRRLHDPGTVRYRQEVFRDLEDPALLDVVQRFSGLLGEVRAHLRQLEQMRDRHQRQGWFLDAAAIYCDAVASLAGHLASAQPGSRALRDFRDYLVSYAASPDFTALVGDTRDRKESLGQIRYCTRIRGGRVEVSRYDGEADYSAAVLKTFERFKQGAARDYLIRYRTSPGMNHVAAQITELVARLFPEEFAGLEAYCRRHDGFPDEAITRADRELQFYLAYLDYLRPVRAAGLSFCYPEVSASSTDVRATGTFDLALARKLVTGRQPVVTNDFHLDAPERVIVVTGPNQGGKTTFARTFGQLHHLAAVGCPVPGSSARLFLPDGIFTHFEREEDIAAMTGKLEDDLIRIGDILEAATGRSIIILNETFASTTTRDASFLGTRLLTKVTRLGALCVYVTFVDELAALGEQVVSMMSTVVPGSPAERTYQVVRKPADGLAHALALAEKYDLTYPRLRERLGTAEPWPAKTGPAARLGEAAKQGEGA